ncbi:hypothetical protein F2P79_010721 [Pimephales promelas]|nr:hypothetical protein F2P79_010721 [Pimephales promelas]
MPFGYRELRAWPLLPAPLLSLSLEYASTHLHSLLCCKFICCVKQQLAREWAVGFDPFVKRPLCERAGGTTRCSRFDGVNPLQWTIVIIRIPAEAMGVKTWRLPGGPPLGPCIPELFVPLISNRYLAIFRFSNSPARAHAFLLKTLKLPAVITFPKAMQWTVV